MVLVVLRPGALWAVVIILAAAMVLAAEAFNAAIEYLADAVHPDYHPLVGAAKDAAAGAVLIASLAALGTAAAVAYSCLP
jgi:undecaprenol kinase